MKTVVGVSALSPPEGGSAVTVGTFDGVHVGHRALIARAIDEARRMGVSSAAVTWDRHPAQTLRPDAAPALITTQERKMELLSETELGLVVVLPFDDELSRWPPERFVADVLVGGLGATAVVVGRDWRFGHKASGDVALLEALGRAHGFAVEGMELAEVAGERVSSSRVRRAVGEGDLDLARRLLGRPFDVDGTVVRGDDRGRALGFPTANLRVDPAAVIPAPGIYAGRGRAAGSWYAAAIAVGYNPTFGGDAATSPLRLEAHLLDYDDELYGEVVRVEFWERLRDEIKYDSADALVAQMAKDVDATRRLVP